MARPRTHDAALRGALLESASRAVAESGVVGMSLRAVAAAAGTTTAAVYSLFGSREALVDAVVDEGFERFAARLATVADTDDPRADLISLGQAYRTNALENPHYYRVMFTEASGVASRGRSDPTFQVLVRAVERAAGCDRPGAADRATRLWAYVHGLVSLELAGLITDAGADRTESYLADLRAALPLLLASAEGAGGEE
ncbi:TetR/AcrR family transcriptional regulator [Xylanimonas oleitrophica]|uniref:TetR/AcrR family transcriptional regulator n=1 Tax=Xylanimonas oleitrophica TaxID=2607479 RepID=A0A2W5WQ22_9MICO|nr:TetR-like C-terminal domain-containing protein [Xylanimonas oleitrophica]PZR52793.1 TetR/AcrR family transcriptional regulator [Xylanimonas oleitrophica]